MDYPVRQGDVLLVPVKELPEGAKKQRQRKRIVLAEGEATGHAHTITINRDEVEVFFEELEMYLRVGSSVKVNHQEHDSLVLDPGIYRVERQKEYGPQEIRRVAD